MCVCVGRFTHQKKKNEVKNGRGNQTMAMLKYQLIGTQNKKKQ